MAAYMRVLLRPTLSSVLLFLVIITQFILSLRPDAWYMYETGACGTGRTSVTPPSRKCPRRAMAQSTDNVTGWSDLVGTRDGGACCLELLVAAWLTIAPTGHQFVVYQTLSDRSLQGPARAPLFLGFINRGCGWTGIELADWRGRGHEGCCCYRCRMRARRDGDGGGGGCRLR